jgi:hypothetical protein
MASLKNVVLVHGGSQPGAVAALIEQAAKHVKVAG